MGTVNRLLRKSPSLISKAVYATVPFAYRYGKIYRVWEKFLRESERWSIENLKLYQNEELRELMQYAYRHTKYYKRIFDERKILPRDINTVEDLKKLPILTREDLFKHKDEMVANFPIKRPTTLKSSGSTGTPVQVIADKSLYEKEAAFVERAYNAHDSTLYYGKSVWVRRYVPHEGEPDYYYDHELRRMYMSAYNLSKYTIKEYVDVINATKAPLLVTYASAAYILAFLMEEAGLKFKYVKVIHTASEKMLDEWKEKIESVFGIPTKTHYGMIEKTALHFQCNQTNKYHECLEYGVTEIVDGQVISTGFLNYEMPLIRYKINDMAILNTGNKFCTCGSSLPLTIEDFIGRSDDIITTKDGRFLPGVNFYTMMYKIDGIRMFKIIQHSIEDIEVQVVPTDTLKVEDIEDKLRVGMTERVGKSNLEINFIDEIPRSKETGKIRCVETKIKR